MTRHPHHGIIFVGRYLKKPSSVAESAVRLALIPHGSTVQWLTVKDDPLCCNVVKGEKYERFRERAFLILYNCLGLEDDGTMLSDSLEPLPNQNLQPILSVMAI